MDTWTARAKACRWTVERKRTTGVPGYGRVESKEEVGFSGLYGV